MAEEDDGKTRKSFLKSFGKTAKEDSTEEDEKGKSKTFSKWRLFSLGAILGIVFGMVSVGIPSITGLFLKEPVFLIPQPFVDTTNFTEAFLPTAPTGATLDLGIILLGFVIPFWAVVGTFLAVLATVFINPLLYSMGVLTTWQPGMDGHGEHPVLQPCRFLVKL